MDVFMEVASGTARLVCGVLFCVVGLIVVMVVCFECGEAFLSGFKAGWDSGSEIEPECPDCGRSVIECRCQGGDA